MQLQMRIEKIQHSLDRIAAEQSRESLDCICFPETDGPAVGFPILQDIAFCVKCPLHGDRFVPRFFIYVPKWMREKLYRDSTTLESSFMSGRKRPEQHVKAYLASFPPDLFPGSEETEKVEKGHSKIFVRLLDGTRIQVAEDRYYGLYDTRPDPEIAKAHDMQWRLETFRTLARLLSKRGLIIEPAGFDERPEPTSEKRGGAHEKGNRDHPLQGSDQGRQTLPRRRDRRRLVLFSRQPQ